MKNRIVVPLLLFVAVMLSYRGALQNEFYWDDRGLVLEGKLIGSWSALPTIFTHELFHDVDLGQRAPIAKVDTYRPFLTASLLLDNMLWKGNPAGFHLTNILIHAINVLLVYFFASLVLRLSLAWLAALLFAFHPIVLECVHYVSARSDSLTFLFCALSLWFGLRRENKSRMDLSAMSIFYLFALFTKETALLVPVVWLIGQHFVYGPQTVQKYKGEAIAFGSGFLVYWLLRLHALGQSKTFYDWQHVGEMILNFPAYFARMMLNVIDIANMTMPMHTFSINRHVQMISVWFLPGLFYVFLSALFAWSLQKRWKFGFFLAAVIAFLLPGFLAVSLTEVANPRYIYYIVAPYALLMASVIHQIRSTRWTMIAGAALVACFFGEAMARSKTYRTEEQFYIGILEETPYQKDATYNLANTYFRRGNWKNAIHYYERLIRKDPSHTSAKNNLALAYMQTRNNVAAQDLLIKLVELNPKNARYHYNLSLIYENTRDRRKECQTLHQTLELDPTYAEAATKFKSHCSIQ